MNKIELLRENFESINTVLDIVELYQKKYRHPDLVKFEIYNGLYDLYPEEPTQYTECIESDYRNEWPHNKRAGVYLIFSNEMKLLYVGKSSVAIGSRLYKHYNSEWRMTRPRFVLVVAVPESFEAASLEEFLIKNTNTEYNSALIE